ncbi:MAG: hypothetical protein AAFQ82_22470, partial [Myxococcota bacterium]
MTNPVSSSDALATYLNQLGELRADVARRDGYWEELDGYVPSRAAVEGLGAIADGYEELSLAFQSVFADAP